MPQISTTKIIGITIVVLIAAGFIVWQKTKPVPPSRSNVTKSALNETPPSPQIKEGGSEINPVSLPALMQKQFDGRDLKLGQILEDHAAYTRYFITYKSGQLTISGIMNIPKGNPPEGGWPVLFLNHGHIDTSVYTNGRGLRREQDYLARNDYAVLHSDYRNHAQSDKDPDAEGDVRIGYVIDVINAVVAVQNSDIQSLNKQKLGMLGHSMGGGITQAVMVAKPDLVDAMVLYAPVSSDVVDSYNRWLSRNAENLEQIKSRHGTPQQNPQFWQDLSPKNFFSKVKAPILIFHGTADESCDIEWSRQSRNLLAAAGKTVELVEYPGQPHEFSSAHTDFMQKTATFFKTNLH